MGFPEQQKGNGIFPSLDYQWMVRNKSLNTVRWWDTFVHIPSTWSPSHNVQLIDIFLRISCHEDIAYDMKVSSAKGHAGWPMTCILARVSHMHAPQNIYALIFIAWNFYVAIAIHWTDGMHWSQAIFVHGWILHKAFFCMIVYFPMHEFF